MADLGLIARAPEVAGETMGSIVGPSYAGGTIQNPLALNGSLSGSVSVGATPVVGAKLLLYWRGTMQLVARTFTDSTGHFSFTSLPPANNAFDMIAFDPEGGTQYNDQLKSLLTPG